MPGAVMAERRRILPPPPSGGRRIILTETVPEWSLHEPVESAAAKFRRWVGMPPPKRTVTIAIPQLEYPGLEPPWAEGPVAIDVGSGFRGG